MWLALETSGDALSVAVGWPGRVLSEAHAPGPRVHAEAILPMIEAQLAETETSLGELRGIVLTDGPGSFTGLRIGASVAKALARSRALEVWTVPSLLAAAVTADLQSPGHVLAVADALRGEVYAAMYRFPTSRVEVEMAAGVFRPKQLADRLPPPAAVAGEISPELGEVLAHWAPHARVRPDARPRAATLIRLLGLSGGASRIAEASLSSWEPHYGRLAEAQVRWERDHGRPLDHQGG